VLGSKDQLDHKVQPAHRARPERKDLRDCLAQLVPQGSAGQQGPAGLQGVRGEAVRPVLQDRLALRANRGRQAPCVTSKGPEMPLRAMFARKALLAFRGLLGRNAAQQLAWLDSACGNSPSGHVS
jgi:hypothetical protein